MKRFLPTLLATCGPLLAPMAIGVEPPNILFISIDDLRPELGCYGSEIARTPHIDRLSASGVTFDNCHVQVAVCNPSRASMMTGLRPNTLGCWTLDYHFRETKPEAVTLPQYLRQHGYHAEGYGKIFHNPWQDPRSWSIPHRFGQGDWNHYDEGQLAFTKRVRDSLPAGAGLRSKLRGPITNDPDIPDASHPDGDMARIVCGRLESLKDSDKPFFLATGFILPHLPFCPPKAYWDLYDRDSLPLAANPRPVQGVPAVELGTNYEFQHYADAIDLPSPLEGKASDGMARRLIHGYLASISFIDAQVGLVLDALEQQGLAESTIVVLWSDHGYKLGEHNGWGKMTNLEIDSRVPFIIRDPRAEANGKRCKSLVESIDIFPTLCELAGLPAPSFTEGKSAADLIDQPDAGHIDASFNQYIWRPLIGNSIRTPDWRYTEWCEIDTGNIKHRILYDHRSDDLENRNVFGQHRDIADKLQKRLHATLPNQPTELLPKVHSQEGGETVRVTFVNEHPGVVRLTWISPTGRRARGHDLARGRSHPSQTFNGHVFVAESLDGKYHEVIAITPGEREIILGGSR